MIDVAVIGVGQSFFVRNYNGNIKELMFDSFKEAVLDANIEAKDIDASVLCSAPEYDRQRSPSGVIAEYLGLNPKPTFYIETLCSSGTTGISVAYSMIKSGMHNIVAVLGLQKMSELSSEETQELMGRGADIQWESPFGTMMPAYYAMHARAHMNLYETTSDDLALIRCKSSVYGTLNEKAVYRKSVNIEMLQNSDNFMSEIVSSPLRVGDCCANADGSSCVILASSKKAKSLCKKPVWIAGIGSATDSVNLSGRKNLTSLYSAKTAAKKAYKMAGVTSNDINIAEVHDCFTIAELMSYEDLGFAEKGCGKELIRSKNTYLEGKIPVNIDGGLLSKGHPIGATGGSQVRTIVLQLRGDSNSAQINKAKIGLVHNIGGVGIYSNVIIFSL